MYNGVKNQYVSVFGQYWGLHCDGGGGLCFKLPGSIYIMDRDARYGGSCFGGIYSFLNRKHANVILPKRYMITTNK